jgi:hypothetical protein
VGAHLVDPSSGRRRRAGTNCTTAGVRWPVTAHGAPRCAAGLSRFGLGAEPAMLGLKLKMAMHYSLNNHFPNLFFQFKIFRNLYKLLKYIENKIKLGKIQNKFPYNPFY